MRNHNLSAHEKYMRKCLELAIQGEGRVSPNPLVGCVVLDKNGLEAGSGFHENYGEPHAEINALDNLNGNPQGGTLYVNLEPCCHHGKTPPCIDRIIQQKIKTLVVGMSDPNPKVSCRGLEMAKSEGIEVIEGVLESECKKLNEIFIVNMLQNRAFVAIKTASSIDGKIAARDKSSKWISGEDSRETVHRLRNKYDAIMSGSGTITSDNPSLNCRIQGGRNPVRVIIDSQLSTPPDSKVYKDDGTKILIAVSENIDKAKTILYPKYIQIVRCPSSMQKDADNKIDLNFLFKKLYDAGIKSVLVEAGGNLNGAIISHGLADKGYFFTAPKIIGDKQALSSFEGINPPNINQCLDFRFDTVSKTGRDIFIEGYF